MKKYEIFLNVVYVSVSAAVVYGVAQQRKQTAALEDIATTLVETYKK